MQEAEEPAASHSLLSAAHTTSLPRPCTLCCTRGATRASAVRALLQDPAHKRLDPRSAILLNEAVPLGARAEAKAGVKGPHFGVIGTQKTMFPHFSLA